MSHITKIELENYRPFLKASCRLSPFTLIVGANNAGKSNLLRALSDASEYNAKGSKIAGFANVRHHSTTDEATASITIHWKDAAAPDADGWTQADADIADIFDRPVTLIVTGSEPLGSELRIYRLSPEKIGKAESRIAEPVVMEDGEGVSRLLDQWNSGASALRARFNAVVDALKRCVPEVKDLSFYDDNEGRRAIQVEQAGLSVPVPLKELSDGTRLVLAILTLVTQENPPPVLLLEDIDRGLHPRLYEQLVAFLRTLAAEGRTQIVTTTHDPYLIDEFRETPEAVVIVEKKDGASTLSNLDERIERLREMGADLEMPLGQVWFSGMVGGVPGPKLPEIFKSTAA